MQLTNRTVLIVGGTSGIGLGWARRLAAANTVVVASRRATSFDEFPAVEMDVTDDGSVSHARDEILRRWPAVDLVIVMSGVMRQEDLREPSHFADAKHSIDVNLLGTIRVTDAFTPHLINRGAGDLVTVSSGIAFLPFPLMPSYAASKAGVHAYTEALRAQLAPSGVTVTELVPPAVATAGQEGVNPHALPLDGFLNEVTELISAEPTPNEVLVRGVQMHRWAERDGTYAELVERRSAGLAALPGRR